AWRIDPARGDDFRGAGYGAAAVAGYPSLTVPMGSRDGLPLGLTFMGRAWSEPRLLELGYAYEQRTLARTPPAFLKTLPHPH
ncbi:MAG TPA: secreted peptide amidase, partial [Xanthomonadaceae bacterium]|nr:secreted peptide amidase [Xanthomonadaceae bacterium]